MHPKLAAIWSILALALLGSAEETVHDAARIARTLVDSSPDGIGTMSTIYPVGHPLAGEPFGLQEYYANCHTNGSLTLLVLPISRHSQNILHSPARAASLTVAAPRPRASRARVALLGTVTVWTDLAAVPERAALEACYLARHPDARWWLPGDENGAHISYWARFDPHSVYFVGGFGTTHYIGYIPLDIYASATAYPTVDALEDSAEDGVDHDQSPANSAASVAGRIFLVQP